MLVYRISCSVRSRARFLNANFLALPPNASLMFLFGHFLMMSLYYHCARAFPLAVTRVFHGQRLALDLYVQNLPLFLVLQTQVACALPYSMRQVLRIL